MKIDYKNYYPAGETDIPVLLPEEIEYLRNKALTAASIRCRFMIDTGETAPGNCRCHLTECNNPKSEIYRDILPNCRPRPLSRHPRLGNTPETSRQLDKATADRSAGVRIEKELTLSRLRAFAGTIRF